MYYQQVSVDLFNMVYTAVAYLALAGAAWLFLRLIQACIWLPSHMKRQNDVQRMLQNKARLPFNLIFIWRIWLCFYRGLWLFRNAFPKCFSEMLFNIIQGLNLFATGGEFLLPTRRRLRRATLNKTKRRAFKVIRGYFMLCLTLPILWKFIYSLGLSFGLVSIT
jgi:hypothetical protein